MNGQKEINHDIPTLYQVASGLEKIKELIIQFYIKILKDRLLSDFPTYVRGTSNQRGTFYFRGARWNETLYRERWEPIWYSQGVFSEEPYRGGPQKMYGAVIGNRG